MSSYTWWWSVQTKLSNIDRYIHTLNYPLQYCNYNINIGRYTHTLNYPLHYCPYNINIDLKPKLRARGFFRLKLSNITQNWQMQRRIWLIEGKNWLIQNRNALRQGRNWILGSNWPIQAEPDEKFTDTRRKLSDTKMKQTVTCRNDHYEALIDLYDKLKKTDIRLN